jgi:predicted outer membrane repeat protein
MKFLGIIHTTAAVLVTVVVLLFAFTAPVHANGTVTDCLTDDDFSNKLAGGGLVTFNCGNFSQAATIVFGSGSSGGTKTITANTTIDGGFLITLSGGYGYRLFSVNSGVTLTLKNITLINGYNPNSAGGAAVSNAGHLILDHVTISNMVDSAFNGGGIGTTGAVEITNSWFHDNKATNGGAIYANGASAVVTISNTMFQNNKATGITADVNGFGGAIYGANGAQITISASDIYSNTAASGGGIYMANLASTLNISDTQIRHNAATVKGAGMLNDATTHLSFMTLHDNTGIGNALGGGIYNYGNLTLTNVTLYKNIARYGGGMSNAFATANVTNTTFSGNTATAYGGGLDNISSTLNLTNVTFSGNSAGSGGGGIFNENFASTHLNLKNVLLAKSASGGNCFFQKVPDTSDHNLSSDASCNFGAGRDSVKMKLGPLETNGGSTLTHRLKPGSAAIDNGVSVVSLPTDQRGVTRPQGTSFDVGAVEFVPCAGAPTKPVLLAPKQGEELSTQTVILDWAGPDCAKTFNVELRQDSKSGAVLFSKSKIQVTQAAPPKLAKFHKYFWRVTACNKAGCVTSGWGKFKVQ